ncbi:hypothetical protein A3G06_01325 [Candidatus Nomurabacteria bacterium RIFCSPLOWO2_12_FULL_46_14]|uniref:Phosphatidic acid phosphatase type 2/haloperoxidase domain-containing protein n=1 Tax=Candidatus Nomurabacteria bacterium RIFCSPLOWO2_12_FULL_46_14 TaxID=1801797 RepID=A0A1F6YCN9_9BACT|nr:MAG: hypothetical protein A3G06_01325 [Candidatus Nomurabacteria bacterium RIFCSPLOWO2_12_FULL_46_14]
MNREIFYFFYNLANRSPFFDQTIVFFAVYFPFIAATLAAVLFGFYYKKRRELIFIFLAAGLAWLIAYFLKDFIASGRPFVSLADISSLFLKESYAFPSGHAAFFGALAVAIFLNHRQAGYVFIIFALLIGAARIAAGVHFPIDILGGFVLGALVAYFMRKV